MILLVSNEIYLIEIIIAVVEIIGAILLFALLAYIMVRNKKLVGRSDGDESAPKSDKEPEIRYVYVSAPPPEGTVVYQNAPAQYAPPQQQPVYEQPAPVYEAQPQQPVYEQPPQEYAPPTELPQEPFVAATDSDDSDDDDGDDGTEVQVRMEGSVAHYYYTRYNRSFTAKLVLGTDDAKRYYSEVKNALLSYKGVKSRISWKWDSFRLGRKTLAKLKFSGKSVALCLALDPKQFEGTKYSVRDLSDKATYADTPTMYRVKNERRLKFARELIDMVMSAEGAPKSDSAEVVDYAAQFPKEDRDALMQRNLIKMSTREETREIPPQQEEPQGQNG